MVEICSRHKKKALTLELGQRVSQHPQLFALLLDVLLRHQAVVDGRVPLKLLHRLLQVTAGETQAANHSTQRTSGSNVS